MANQNAQVNGRSNLEAICRRFKPRAIFNSFNAVAMAIIHYSLLLSPNYYLFISNFSMIFIIHFLVFDQFSVPKFSTIQFYRDIGYQKFTFHYTFIFSKFHSIFSIHVVKIMFSFCQGSGKPFAQKVLVSCPNFYKTVEKKQVPYDAITQAVLASEIGSIQFFRVNTCQV